jgi:hypothetical protein
MKNGWSTHHPVCKPIRRKRIYTVHGDGGNTDKRPEPELVQRNHDEALARSPALNPTSSDGGACEYVLFDLSPRDNVMQKLQNTIRRCIQTDRLLVVYSVDSCRVSGDETQPENKEHHEQRHLNVLYYQACVEAGLLEFLFRQNRRQQIPHYIKMLCGFVAKIAMAAHVPRGSCDWSIHVPLITDTLTYLCQQSAQSYARLYASSLRE